MTVAHVLWHVREGDEHGEGAKLIGVYSSKEAADGAIARLGDKPGFRDHPAGFDISEYPIDKDHWVDGFISWEEASAED